jgi:EAL domain-containing protein (putative c-di-GMP-specific phosphodiesterase class I)
LISITYHINTLVIDVSVDVDVSISKLPNATELEQFAAQIAAELGVDPARVVVTVSQSDGGFTITITIIGAISMLSYYYAIF